MIILIGCSNGFAPERRTARHKQNANKMSPRLGIGYIFAINRPSTRSSLHRNARGKRFDHE
jgi:hypothetical protein